ncbi:Gamma-aminobutyric acid receptor subunit beta-4 [Armadillidium vulgare]|nr:Gamma-aminobutyric acid receptor subunit beta-4 [Armadillidium vulgare]
MSIADICENRITKANTENHITTEFDDLIFCLEIVKRMHDALPKNIRNITNWISFCIFVSSKELQYLSISKILRLRYGSYVKGEDMEISFIFSGLVNVPCRFDLKKYPFGTQTCNLTFWPDNLLRTVDYEFFFKSLHGFEGKDIVYEGRKALGEYQFVNAFREVVNKKYVKVTLILKNLFGFHMLNSFTPSFLICIISYATYFFPISAFNERIMVLLTSLLVLTALFTQSSNTSVATPYFKLLDIWYVTLIFFCFMTVISNLMIHKIFLLEETAVKAKTTDGKEEKLSDNSETGLKYLEKYNSIKINFIAIIIFSFLYAILLLLFSLSAAEVI